MILMTYYIYERIYITRRGKIIITLDFNKHSFNMVSYLI